MTERSRATLGRLTLLGVFVALGLAAQTFDLVDWRATLELARDHSTRWWLPPLLVLLQVMLFAFALPGSAVLWLVAPLYPLPRLCALRLTPGVPRAVINYASGVLQLRLTPFLASAAIGFGVKSFLYSSVIHGALTADKPADLLEPAVVWTLVGIVVLALFARAVVRRRS